MNKLILTTLGALTLGATHLTAMAHDDRGRDRDERHRREERCEPSHRRYDREDRRYERDRRGGCRENDRRDYRYRPEAYILRQIFR